HPGRFGMKQFRLLQLLISLGMILSIAGGTSSAPDPTTGKITIPTTSKVGIILYILAFVGISLMLLFASRNAVSVPKGEHMLYGAVLVALPFILVRLAFSALAVFVHDHHFNVID